MLSPLQFLAIVATCIILAPVVALWIWSVAAPTSHWFCVGFPLRVVRTHLSWTKICDGCHLSIPYRIGPDGQPQNKYPRLGAMTAHRFGFNVWISLLPGQTPENFKSICPELSHAWRVHSVQILDIKPGAVFVSVTATDPLTNVIAPPPETEVLRAAVGMLETGAPWVIDFRTIPHWLIVGATQSGKSTLLNALIVALSQQRVALVGIDLKQGVELGPYQPRLSRLATTRSEAVEVLAQLIVILTNRLTMCGLAGKHNIWELPDEDRPAPIVCVIDEVAELYLMTSSDEKDDIVAVTTSLLRIAQLGRAVGIHLLVAGQRFGSDIGTGVTALRAQLGGRICHRVNDPETSRMVLGDLAPDGVKAAQSISHHMRGVAVAVTDGGFWHRARSVYTSGEQAEQAARDNAHLAPTWQALISLTDNPSAGTATEGDQDNTAGDAP
ncbi:MAG: FtsK/SpoIIIE domain-containing protein [Mycobacteriales bacterium]